jgi:Asp-tRNA(Asn)/Glu-tRNA(Gln) amidotransferase A subunit family amidase
MRNSQQCIADLAAGRITAEDLARECLGKIRAEDQDLNSFIHVDPKDVIKQAKASDARRRKRSLLSKLDGVPFAVKDNIAIAGRACSAGMAVRRDRIAKNDAFCVGQLRAAGAVIMGRLNMHEGALGADNNNPHFGACHNPNRHGFTPGGSSGGSAAAVAAGFVPMSLGTDTMGSVRIPAAYCGVVGFKPSYGLISQSGVIPSCRALDHVGIITRSAGDVSAWFELMQRRDSKDPYQLDCGLAESRAVSHLRIGVLDDWTRHGVLPAMAAVVHSALAKLSEPFKLVSFSDYNFATMRRAGLLATEADMAAFHHDDLAQHPELFSESLRNMLNFAERKTAVDLAASYQRMAQAKAKARQVFTGVDMLLTPTTPQTAFAFTETAPANQADLTSFANLAGCPAISIPCGDVEGLPVGLQIIGPVGTDLSVIAVAMSIEKQMAATYRYH